MNIMPDEEVSMSGIGLLEPGYYTNNCDPLLDVSDGGGEPHINSLTAKSFAKLVVIGFIVYSVIYLTFLTVAGA